MNQTIKSGFVTRGLHWPLGIIMFFVALAVVNVWLVITAVQGRPDRVVEDPYTASLQYDETIAMLQFAQRLGLTVAVSYQIQQNAAGSLQLKLSDPDKAAEITRVEVSIRRADTAQLDQSVLMQKTDSVGSYRATELSLLPGIWHLAIQLHLPGGVALFQETLRVPS